MVEAERITALEYIRQRGGGTSLGIEFARFAVGYPRDAKMDDIFLAFLEAKHGPAEISMATQHPEEFTSE